MHPKRKTRYQRTVFMQLKNNKTGRYTIYRVRKEKKLNKLKAQSKPVPNDLRGLDASYQTSKSEMYLE